MAKSPRPAGMPRLLTLPSDGGTASGPRRVDAEGPALATAASCGRGADAGRVGGLGSFKEDASPGPSSGGEPWREEPPAEPLLLFDESPSDCSFEHSSFSLAEPLELESLVSFELESSTSVDRRRRERARPSPPPEASAESLELPEPPSLCPESEEERFCEWPLPSCERLPEEPECDEPEPPDVFDATQLLSDVWSSERVLVLFVVPLLLPWLEEWSSALMAEAMAPGSKRCPMCGSVAGSRACHERGNGWEEDHGVWVCAVRGECANGHAWRFREGSRCRRGHGAVAAEKEARAATYVCRDVRQLQLREADRVGAGDVLAQRCHVRRQLVHALNTNRAARVHGGNVVLQARDHVRRLVELGGALLEAVGLPLQLRLHHHQLSLGVLDRLQVLLPHLRRRLKPPRLPLEHLVDHGHAGDASEHVALPHSPHAAVHREGRPRRR